MAKKKINFIEDTQRFLLGEGLDEVQAEDQLFVFDELKNNVIQLVDANFYETTFSMDDLPVVMMDANADIDTVDFGFAHPEMDIAYLNSARNFFSQFFGGVNVGTFAILDGDANNTVPDALMMCNRRNGEEDNTSFLENVKMLLTPAVKEALRLKGKILAVRAEDFSAEMERLFLAQISWNKTLKEFELPEDALTVMKFSGQ